MRKQKAGVKLKTLLFLSLLAICLCSCSNIDKQEISNTQNNVITIDETDSGYKIEEKILSGKIIVVDAGHGIPSNYGKMEAISPNSTQTKLAYASGTAGANCSEEELNLSIALMLEKRLLEEGATVHMTRTTHNSEMSNIDRAKFGNEHRANLSVKIHADGNTNKSVKGTSMLIPAQGFVADDVYFQSKKAGGIVHNCLINEIGSIDRGVVERSDMTGFNWSEVPVILTEVGFMTNPDEDYLLSTEEYRQKIVNGLTKGIIKYFEEIK